MPKATLAEKYGSGDANLGQASAQPQALPSHRGGLERCLGSYFYLPRGLAWAWGWAHLLREELCTSPPGTRVAGRERERESVRAWHGEPSCRGANPGSVAQELCGFG